MLLRQLRVRQLQRPAEAVLTGNKGNRFTLSSQNPAGAMPGGVLYFPHAADCKSATNSTLLNRKRAQGWFVAFSFLPLSSWVSQAFVTSELDHFTCLREITGAPGQEQ